MYLTGILRCWSGSEALPEPNTDDKSTEESKFLLLKSSCGRLTLALDALLFFYCASELEN